MQAEKFMMYLFSSPMAQLKTIYILFEPQEGLLHKFTRIPSADPENKSEWFWVTVGLFDS